MPEHPEQALSQSVYYILQILFLLPMPRLQFPCLAGTPFLLPEFLPKLILEAPSTNLFNILILLILNSCFLYLVKRSN